MLDEIISSAVTSAYTPASFAPGEYIRVHLTNPRYYFVCIDLRSSSDAPFVTQCDTCVYLGDNVVASQTR